MGFTEAEKESPAYQIQAKPLYDLVQRKKFGGHQENNVSLDFSPEIINKLNKVARGWASTKELSKYLPKEIVDKYAYITLSEPPL